MFVLHHLSPSLTGVTIFVFWSITQQFIPLHRKVYGLQQIFSYIFLCSFYFKYRLIILKNWCCTLQTFSLIFCTFCLLICLPYCLFVYLSYVCFSFCLFPYLSIASLLWTVCPCFYKCFSAWKWFILLSCLGINKVYSMSKK